MPKSISLTVPSRRHHDVARADVAVHDAGLLEDVLQGAADAARDEDAELDVGQAAELAVALEVLDEAPAVDVLEDDAELPVHALEVEDAADVLVVEDGVAPRLLDEEAQVLGVGRLELLDDDRAAGSRPGRARRPLRRCPCRRRPAGGGCGTSARTKRRPPRVASEDCRAPRGCQGTRQRGRYTGRECASWPSTWATCGSGSLSPTRRRRSPRASSPCGRWARARTPRPSRRSSREHDVGEVVVGLPLRLDGSLGSQAEKVAGLRRAPAARAARAGRDAGRAAHLGRGRRATGRGRGRGAATARPGSTRRRRPSSSRSYLDERKSHAAARGEPA